MLGGDTLTDFALALLVGILVGTYSSVFVAAPLLVAFERRSGSQPVTAPRPAVRKQVAKPVAATTTPRPPTDRTGARARASAPRPKQGKQADRRSRGRRR
jgi:SecD/SecF fusion protein